MNASLATTGTVLDRIIAQTKIDIEKRKAVTPEPLLLELLASKPRPVDMHAALHKSEVAVIAEFKRASPSRGRFPFDATPSEVAHSYIDGGAAAISCLTDTPFFQGNLDDLLEVSGVGYASTSPVGVLRKDFIIDSYQIIEARAFGASCILLIAACLPDTLLVEFHRVAQAYGMATLVEVHDEAELERALHANASLIGINNRDLHTFEVSLEVTRRLAPLVPQDVLLVGESGIFTRDEVEELAAVGVDAVLVGESLIVQPNRVAAVQALIGVEKGTRG